MLEGLAQIGTHCIATDGIVKVLDLARLLRSNVK